MSAAMPNHERLEELLADRATCGLSDSGEFELQSLSGGDPDDAAFEMELAAAAVALAVLPAEDLRAEVPGHVRARLEQTAPLHRSGASLLKAPPQTAPGNDVVAKLNWWGWMAAAASLTLAAIGWWPRLTGSATRLSPEEMSRQPGAFTTNWASWAPKPPSEDPEAKDIDWSSKVRGRVIWSSDRQTGFMVFEGMKPNDPAREQYQLWIIDAEQKHPVDGGVFDINSAGEAVVPITPKIKVGQPVAFAVTIEKPGGVVVSEQHERVVVAAVANGK